MAKSNCLLIVDDEEDIVDLILARILLHAKKEIEPLVATDGYEALEYMKTKNVAVVILDLQMRHMDGMSVCRQAKADEKLKDIPIIVSSGILGEDNKKQLEALGVKHFLPKPYKLDDLMDMVSHFIPFS